MIVKGMRDFPPEEAILFEEVIERIRNVMIRYGFDPIITPIVEYWDVLKGKYGDEAESKEIWRFRTVWSKKEYGLRYDLTVPLARFYSRFYDRIKLPFKRYQIGRVYRYEEPQRGRYREFWQADADIIGSDTPESDAEVLNLFREIMEELGFENFLIRISNRRIFEKVIEKFGVIDRERAYRIIDKKDRMSREEFSKKVSEVVRDYEGFLNLLEIKDYLEFLEEVGRIIGEDGEVERMYEVYDFLFRRRRYCFDLSIVRGLEYYTGMVFEIFLKEFNKAVGGGGRYDDLVGMFIGRRVPAVGGSVGVSRLLEFVGFERKKTRTKIAVVPVKRENFGYAWEVCYKLREMGISTYIDLNRKGFREQFEYIDQKGIRYVVIVGDREEAEEKIRIKDRERREEFELKLDELEKIKEII